MWLPRLSPLLWALLAPGASGLVLAALPAPGATAQAPEVPVTVMPEFASVRPGGVFRVAVRLHLPDGWHIGWINAGESGLPTTISWRTPAAVRAEEPEWPYPERLEVERSVSHVYRGVVVIVTPFRVDPAARRGTVRLDGDLSWGICSNICIPQERTVRASLQIGPGPAVRSPEWAEVESGRAAFPVPGSAATLWALARGDSVELTIAAVGDWPSPGSAVTFFPVEPGRAAVAAPARPVPGAVVVTLPAGVVSGTRPGRLVGVLVADRAWRHLLNARALRVDLSVGEAQRGRAR